MSTITIHDVDLFYELTTPPSPKGTIVFLNGVMATASSWSTFVDLFKKHGYQVLVHDFRGQLRSSKPLGPYSFLQHAQDTIALCEALNITKPHLIGTSYGGEVALCIASHYPQFAHSITLINSVSELDHDLIQRVKEWKLWAQTYDGAFFFNSMLEGVYHSRYLKANEALLQTRAKQFATLPKDYFDGQIALYDTFMSNLYLTPYLHRIRIPTCIVVGEDDTLKPRKFSDIILRHIPHAQMMVLPQCAHVTIFEQPATLSSILLGFILTQ